MPVVWFVVGMFAGWFALGVAVVVKRDGFRLKRG